MGGCRNEQRIKRFPDNEVSTEHISEVVCFVVAKICFGHVKLDSLINKNRPISGNMD